MNFPKKQAQRLIPEYLLDYTTKLQNSHPDPTDSWGGGSNYTSGDGIDITNNVISVDNTIAKKSDIPTKTSELTNDSGFTTQTWVENQGYSKFSGSYNDLNDKPDLSIYAQSSNLSTVATTGSYNDLIDKPTIPDTSNFVTTDTNQTIVGTKKFTAPVEVMDVMLSRSTALNGQGYFLYRDGVEDKVTIFGLPRSKTGGTEANPTQYTLATTDDIPTVPTLATVATTGSYNDLLDKPTIPDTTNLVTLDTSQRITGFKTFDPGKLEVERVSPIRMKLIFKPDVFIYSVENGRADFKLPTSKPKGTEDAPTEYTLATTDDIINSDNFVTLDTAQTITGAKTFQNGLFTENTTFGIKMNMVPGRFIHTYNNNGTIETTLFDLPTGKTPGTEQQPTTYTIATTDDIHNYTLNKTTETLTFTYSDNTTGTLTVLTDVTLVQS